MKKMLTVKEVSEILGFSEKAIRKFIAEKRIKAVKIGKQKNARWRIPKEELDHITEGEKNGAKNNI
jgi:excisionase family DNA binding protein